MSRPNGSFNKLRVGFEITHPNATPNQRKSGAARVVTQGCGVRATTSWARLALERGTRAATRHARRDELARLVASFTEGFDTADLQDAQQLLAALA
jgi:hypothetical protein